MESLIFSKFEQKDLDKIAQEILSHFKDDRFFCFYGSMGAGKTTLINSLCRQLGSLDDAVSPTFSIVHRYIAEEVDIYHFDFYRIEDPSEIINIGVEEYFNSGDYCFIEWPEKISVFLPDEYVKIELDIIDELHRDLRVFKHQNQNQ